LELPFNRGEAISSWKAIDEQAAIALIRDALKWLEDHGKFIVSVTDEIWRTSQEQVGLTRSQKRRL
ncbi:hypothetical protein WDZ92_50695, partial [Nostoc sp. NIES-2111]